MLLCCKIRASEEYHGDENLNSIIAPQQKGVGWAVGAYYWYQLSSFHAICLMPNMNLQRA